MRTGRVLFTVLALALLLVGGCARSNPLAEALAPGEDKITTAQTATVADFVESYSENSVKANSDYIGKWVKIRGTIADVRKIKGAKGTNEPDYYLVGLRDDTGKTKSVISCRFNSNKQSAVLALKKGQPAVFYGVIDEADSSGLPVITDCQVVN